MQRLLRGKVFYVALALFVCALFFHTLTSHQRFARMHLDSRGESVVAQLEDTKLESELPAWAKTTIDTEAIRRIATDNLPVGISLFILGLFLVGMSVGGVVYSARALMQGRLTAFWRGTTYQPPAWTFGELGRIILLVLLVVALLPIGRLSLIGFWPDLMDENLWVTASMLFIDGFLLLAILAFSVGKGRPPRAALGLAGGRMLDPIGAGFRGYVTLFPWLVLLLVVIAQLASHFQLEPPVQPIQMLLFAEERPLVLFLTVLLACIVGPVTEEVFFRGVVFAALRQRASRTASMLISGALFAGVHSNAIGFVPIWALGCLLAERYERTGSLVSPIAVHVLHNTFLLSLAMTYRAIMLMA